MSEIVPDRFREAREYLGFTRDQVAEALHCSPLLIAGLEEGGVEPFEGFLIKLAKLYQRPMEWFSGESSYQPSAWIKPALENPRLTDQDREGILDFDEWLQGRKRAPEPRSFTHFPPASGMDDQAAEDNGIVG